MALRDSSIDEVYKMNGLLKHGEVSVGVKVKACLSLSKDSYIARFHSIEVPLLRRLFIGLIFGEKLARNQCRKPSFPKKDLIYF